MGDTTLDSGERGVGAVTGEQLGADRLLAALDVPAKGFPSVVVGVDADRATAHASLTDRFELGSITKTMTAQVLAALVLAGSVRLDDPVERWIDGGANGAISLVQLATHTSGLPRMAPNATSGEFDRRDPYAAYSEELAEEGLRAATVHDVGTMSYSNFGYQLLGVALERAAGTSLRELLAEHVFSPFGMATAALAPVPDLAPGHNRGKVVPPWTMLLHGPGGVVGTVADLMAWGRAVAAPPAGSHGDALRLAVEPRAESPHGRVGLAWHHGDGVVWHNGGTFGCRTCLAVDPSTGRVAAALVASGDVTTIDGATMLAARDLDPTQARPQKRPSRLGMAVSVIKQTRAAK